MSNTCRFCHKERPLRCFPRRSNRCWFCVDAERSVPLPKPEEDANPLDAPVPAQQTASSTQLNVHIPDAPNEPSNPLADTFAAIQRGLQQLEQLAEQSRNDFGKFKHLKLLVEQGRVAFRQLKRLNQLAEQTQTDLGDLKQLKQLAEQTQTEHGELKQLVKRTHTNVDEFKQGLAEVRGFVQRLQHAFAMLPVPAPLEASPSVPQK